MIRNIRYLAILGFFIILCTILLGFINNAFLDKKAIAQVNSNANTITCSSDGKYVFATAGAIVYRSIKYGQRGTWEQVMILK